MHQLWLSMEDGRCISAHAPLYSEACFLGQDFERGTHTTPVCDDQDSNPGSPRLLTNATSKLSHYPIVQSQRMLNLLPLQYWLVMCGMIYLMELCFLKHKTPPPR